LLLLLMGRERDPIFHFVVVRQSRSFVGKENPSEFNAYFIIADDKTI